MENLPVFISIFFGVIVVITITWFYISSGSRTYLLLAMGWTILQSILGLSGFFRDTTALPPRILLFGVVPPLLLIAFTFLSKKGKAFIDTINLKTLTYFHVIRVPVEIVLALLFSHGVVSKYITFEGTNFDLFSGVTAPIVAFLAFRTANTNKGLLLGWNILCLLLLLNVVVTAILSMPTPFQKLDLDHPNIALLYFPFNLLPTIVVPTVLFGHLVAIKRLTRVRE